MHFASIDLLATSLRRPPFEGLDADAAELVLERAASRIRNYTRQTLDYVEDDDVTISGTWDAELRIPEQPCRGVSFVSIDGVEIDLSAIEFTTRRLQWKRYPAGYRHEWSRGRQGANGGPGCGWGGPAAHVRIITSHGYPDPPGDIVDIELAAAVRCMENPTGVRAENLGSYGVTYAGSALDLGAIALSGQERRALRRYRSS